MVSALSVGLALLLAPPPGTGGFVERALAVGLDHEHLAGLDRIGLDDMLDWAQSGIAIGDLDGDGDLDLVACGGLKPTHVFLRDGDVFVDATDASGIVTKGYDRAPALGDFDDDGDLDLFIGVLEWGDGPKPGRSRLYENDGLAHFEEVTTLAGVRGNGHTLFAKWADVDRDGLLDLSLAEFHGTPNKLFLNNGDGSFFDASAFGADDAGSAHVVAVVDTDRNGYPDLFIGNDYKVSAVQDLSSNSGNKHIAVTPADLPVDVSPSSGFDVNLTTMGFAFGDVNYDGLLDIYTTELELNLLMLNGGWPSTATPWAEFAGLYGVQNGTVPLPGGGSGVATGWGTAFAHIDFDPWLDLVVVNGHVSPDDATGQRNFIYRGLGPAGSFHFEDASADLDFLDAIDDRALAVGDIDGDLDLDLLVGATSGRLRYYENQLDRAGQGTLHVRAITRTSAPGGEGVYVEWTDELGYPHVYSIGSDSPAASQHESAVLLALGDEEAVDIRVTYPSGIVLDHEAVPAGSSLVSEEPELIRMPRTTASVDEAGTPFVVTAFAHSQDGTPLGPEAQVAIESTHLVALGPVEHVAGNEFRRSFRLPPKPGRSRFSVEFDSFQVAIRPRLTVYSRPSADDVRLRIEPECVRAGSGEMVEVVFCPMTAQQTAAQQDFTVGLKLSPGPLSLPLEPLGDGRYAGSFEAPEVPGVYSVSARLVPPSGGLFTPFQDLATLEVAGPPDPEATESYVETPNPNIAAAPHQVKVQITPRDAQGLRVGPNVPLTFDILHAPESEPVSIVPEAHGAHPDGDHYFAFGRPAGSETGSAHVLVTAFLEDVAIYSLHLIF